jgi:co-chaperonin GroES (HSP10)
MKVLIPKMGAQKITVDGEDYGLLTKQSILSILEE